MTRREIYFTALFFNFDKVSYPDWAVFLAAVLVFVSVLFIPGVASARYFGLVKYTPLENVSTKDAEGPKQFSNDIRDTSV